MPIENKPSLPSDRRALAAIDLGAESCRVSLLRWIDDKPNIQLIHRCPNHAEERPENGIAGLRWNLSHILKELDFGLNECALIATEGIRSIAVDGWGVDYVRLDENGLALADPFCYRDERTVAAEPALHERIPAERMRELTGIQLLRINTAYQLFADKPELHTHRWINLPEYVLHRLGARPVAELTLATHSQLVALDHTWSPEIFTALDQPIATAPELVKPGTDIGQLTGPLAALPAFTSTRLIAPACHDTASAIAAVHDAGDDWGYISSGTWSLVGTVLNAPVNTSAARAENFTNLGGVDNTICFHKNVNGMWLLRQCIETWSAEGTTHSVPDLVAAAAAFPARDYVLNVDDPDLLLQGHMPQRINAQLNARGLPEFDPTPQHAAELASFIFHSLAARYAEVLANVATITGKHLRKLYIMGGGSQNELLNRLTAEVTGLEVIRAGTECSTIGNFAVQLATLEQTPGPRPTALWSAALSSVS
jgi:rhamnulokinase